MSETTPIMGPFKAHALCPMCGHDDIGTTFHDHERDRLSRYSCDLVRQLSTSYPPIHHCRTCRRCGYKWPEDVLR